MKRFLVLSIILLHSWSLFSTNYYCKKIGIESGLSQSSITGTVYDSSGSLWIGTRFGLNEYRNGKMRTFLDDGSGKISGNYINLLFCDSRNNIWTSTDKGLFRYDRSSDSFMQLSEAPASCAEEIDGKVVFGSIHGIVVWEEGKGLTEPEKPEEYSDIISIIAHDDGILVIKKRQGVFFVKDGKSEPVSIPETRGNAITAAVKYGDDLYLSVMNIGLLSFNLHEREQARVWQLGKNGLPNDLILSLLVTGKELWIGTDGDGLGIMSLESGNFTDVRDPRQFRTNGILPTSITSLYEDPAGNIWIGSVREGLVGLKASPIKSISLSDAEAGLKGSAIIWIFESEDGNIYLGTDGDGIFRYNPASGQLSPATKERHMKVTSIADYDSRRLIISIYNEGYLLMDRSSGRTTPFILIDGETNTAECRRGNAPLLYNLGGTRILLLASHTYCFDTATGQFSRFDCKADNCRELNVIYSEGDGVYLAYSSTGLFRVNCNNNTIERQYSVQGKTGRINTAVYHDGHIWLGTNYGLFEFNSSGDGDIRKVETGLFNRVTRLEHSLGGNLWIAADNSLFLQRNGMVEMIGENRGVPANEVLTSKVGDDGTVYLGGTAGLIEIGKDYPYSSETGKSIELHDVEVQGQRVLSQNSPLALKHNYVSLILTVNVKNADPFEKIMYRYSLVGESGFRTETYEDKLVLPALKPGTYNVQASYRRSDGNWSKAKKVLDIRVKQPWYKSLLMNVLYIITILLGLAVAVNRIAEYRVRKMEAELKAKDKVFIEAITEFIDANIPDPAMNVNQIANHMAMSRAGLYNKVKASFGKGVAELIEEHRMAAAENLLTTTPMSILEISEKTGYTTSRYFSTRFKQLHDGMTPLKYRQSHKS